MRRQRRPAWNWQESVVAWLRYRERHRGLSTAYSIELRGKMSQFIRFAEERGVRDPRSCTLNDVDAWVGVIAQRGLARSTLSTYVSMMRDFVHFLHCEGQLANNFSAHVEGPRVYRETTLPPHFSWSEVEALVEAAVGLRDRAVLTLLKTTGARASEIASLTLDDVDWDGARIILRQRKSKTPLVLPLMPEAAAALRAYLEGERPSDSPHRHVFLTDRGTPLSGAGAVLKVVRRASARAGLADGRGVHAIRRAVGTRLMEGGAGAAEIALLLGHAQLATTRVYIRLSMEQLREVADNYADLL